MIARQAITVVHFVPSVLQVFLQERAVAACASLQKPAPTVNVPDKLKPPANESLAMIVPAKGVQIYECRAKKDQAASYEWAFVAPEADLFDTSGKKIGRHYAGPHWESADGSKIGRHALFQICEARQVHRLVTDRPPPGTVENALRSAGVGGGGY